MFVFSAGKISTYSFYLETQRAVEDARRHDGSRQLCPLLLALPRNDRHVLRVLLLCAGLIALCCAVLAVNGQRQYMLAKELCVLV